VAARLAAGERVEIDLPSGPIELAPEDVELVRERREGWGVAGEGGVTVALDLDIDEDLRLEGLARELVREVQDARKAAGLEVADHIALGLSTEGDLARAARTHAEWIRSEVLADRIELEALPEDAYRTTAEVDGVRLEIALRRIG
jgi:isoleucyl-tRNA synthetase